MRNSNTRYRSLFQAAVLLAFLGTVMSAVPQSDLWVDLTFLGTELGTQAAPYDTVEEALEEILSGGTVHLGPGDSHETPVIGQSMRLEAVGGVARIGVLGSIFGSGAPLRWLRFTELMYHDLSGGAEYLELQNTGPFALDLSGVQFTSGIEFTFADGTVVDPGDYILLVRSSHNADFAARYPGVSHDGFYAGDLSNSGELVSLSTPQDFVFLSIQYDDDASWTGVADGNGFSLVVLDAQGDMSDPFNWTGSAAFWGSPGASDAGSTRNGVVVNEILSHTDLPQVDSIEVWNPTDETIDMRGWFVTDDREDPYGAILPDDAEFLVAPGAFAVIDEEQFTLNPGMLDGEPLEGFRLSEHGEDAYVFSADENGVLTGFAHGFTFVVSANGVTWGREVESDGSEFLLIQTEVTLGAPNSGAAVRENNGFVSGARILELNQLMGLR